jgi:hypothetical protein
MFLDDFLMFFLCAIGFANSSSTVFLSAQVPKHVWSSTIFQGNMTWEVMSGDMQECRTRRQPMKSQAEWVQVASK